MPLPPKSCEHNHTDETGICLHGDIYMHTYTTIVM